MAPGLIGGTGAFILDEGRRAVEFKHAKTIPTQLTYKTAYETPFQTTQPDTQNKYKWDIVWRNVLFFIYLHYCTLAGLYHIFVGFAFVTFFWNVFLAFLVSQGVTAGAHRLWAHKSYKANLPLRIMLAICFTIAFQDDIHQWVRDHRAHHKFTDTDADPYNAKRGFFFSHMGWLITRKHPAVKENAKKIDMTDVLADPVVRFQRKYYKALMPLACFVLPTLLPVYLWNESIFVSWDICMLRYAVTLHFTWLVNSAAHIYGIKPFDKNISPRENPLVSALTFGEGWHNYHHVFPWDYKAAELGFNKLNVTAGIIDFFAKIGWASELKTVSQDMIDRRSERTGDGSRSSEDHQHNGDEIWGWGDQDMPHEEVQEIARFNQLKEQ